MAEALNKVRGAMTDLTNAIDDALASGELTEKGADELMDMMDAVDKLAGQFDEKFGPDAADQEDAAFWRYWHARIDEARGK
jgi:hypothetical protein